MMKRFFKRIAAYFVTLYANYVYDFARKAADKRYSKEHRMIYVATMPFRPGKLTTYDRYRFKAEKEVFGFHARLLTLQTLKNGCYYHTPDTAGNQAMTKREIDVRRLAFARERLKSAGLI